MADLGLELEITTSWTEITTAMSLTAGTQYLLDLDNTESGALGFWALTDTADVEPTVEGHPFLPFNRNLGQITSRLFTKETSVFAWLKVNQGTGKLKASPA